MRHTRTLRRGLVPLLAAGVVALTLAGAAYAADGVTNGSFETGDLTGWTTAAGPGGSVSVLAGGAPGGGSFFAHLFPDGQDVYTTLSQTFTATAGDQLTGWANFFDEEFAQNQPCVFADEGIVEIVNPDASVSQVFFAKHCVTGVGNNASTGWVSWSYIFPATGTYTVQGRLANIGDSAVPSTLDVDAVTYVDNTAPTASCELGPNPSGKNEPNANAGFRTVTAADNVGVTSLVITGGTFTSGELASGDNVKLTFAPGSAGSDVRPGPGVLKAHITTNGQPFLVATDAAGNSTSVPCGPLPPKGK